MANYLDAYSRKPLGRNTDPVTGPTPGAGSTYLTNTPNTPRRDAAPPVSQAPNVWNPGSNLSPVLEEMLASVDRSGAQAWRGQERGISEMFQRRGLGGSGIENEAMTEAGRQHQLDMQGARQSIALNTFDAWLQQRRDQQARMQYDENWRRQVEQMQYQNAAQQSLASKQGRQNMWGSVGDFAGAVIPGLF